MHTDVTQDRKYLFVVFFNLREISIARRFRISAHTSIGTFPWKAFFPANILCEYSASERETYFLVYPARSSHLAYILLLFLIAMQSVFSLEKVQFFSLVTVEEFDNSYRNRTFEQIPEQIVTWLCQWIRVACNNLRNNDIFKYVKKHSVISRNNMSLQYKVQSVVRC